MAKKVEKKKVGAKPSKSVSIKVVSKKKLESIKVKETKKNTVAPTTKKDENVKAIKKEIVAPAIQYVEADKNYFKAKVKTMLISQPKPENDKSQFVDLARLHNIKINFRQFIQI